MSGGRSRRAGQVVLLGGLIVLLSAFGCGAGNTAPVTPPDTPAVPTFDSARAFADLVAQCDFGPRNPGSAGHAACRQWLLARLQSLTGDVTEQTFAYRAATGANFEFANLIAVFGAAGRQDLTTDGLLLGAHWDTRPIADHDPDPARRDEPILGANDGASGVAILLELARHFQATPPPRPIIVVFFDFEDGGLTELTAGEPLSGFSIGARHFAANLGRWRPREAVVVDMCGDANLSLPREANSQASHPTLMDTIYRAGQALGFAAFVDRVGLAITDDHLPLIQAGIPSVDLIDFDYPGPNRHIYWHTHQDTPDKCSPDSLRQVGQTLLQVIYGG